MRLYGRAAALYLLLVAIFAVIAAVAWLFGVSPPELSDWFDRHESWFYAIVDWGMRAFCGFVLLVCGLIVFSIWMEWFGKRGKGFEKAPRDIKGGCCGLTAVVVVGYFAWVGMTMPFD